MIDNFPDNGRYIHDQILGVIFPTLDRHNTSYLLFPVPLNVLGLGLQMDWYNCVFVYSSPYQFPVVSNINSKYNGCSEA